MFDLIVRNADIADGLGNPLRKADLADGRRISILDDWDGGDKQERAFLRTVQASACKRFGTVLGPDYNAAHRDHFHLERGGSASGSFCR